MLLSDKDIRKLVQSHNMLEPFSEAVSGDGVISYGLSHAGYDLRLGEIVYIFKNTFGEAINPKRFREEDYSEKMFDMRAHLKDGEAVVIPPHGYILAVSKEYIQMPKHLKGRCVGKSTLARCGIGINTTPIEPGWNGHLTIEIANHTPCQALIFAGEGICQLEFETLSCIPDTDYADKKYQNQGPEPTPARVL